MRYPEDGKKIFGAIGMSKNGLVGTLLHHYIINQNFARRIARDLHKDMPDLTKYKVNNLLVELAGSADCMSAHT